MILGRGNVVYIPGVEVPGPPHILAVTGHRPKKLGNEWDGEGPVSRWLWDKMIDIVFDEHPTAMISGMALGVDQLWARIAIFLGKPLIAAVPFIGQEKVWPQDSRERYDKIIMKAASVINVSGDFFYKREYMQKRNEWMVDHCQALVAVWDGSSGGTANCVAYAEEVGRRIIWIDPRKYEE